jgi:hypothetical protein
LPEKLGSTTVDLMNQSITKEKLLQQNVNEKEEVNSTGKLNCAQNDRNLKDEDNIWRDEEFSTIMFKISLMLMHIKGWWTKKNKWKKY